jgi:hypothetical protein
MAAGQGKDLDLMSQPMKVISHKTVAQLSTLGGKRLKRLQTNNRQMSNVNKMLLATVGACLVTLFSIGWLLYTAWFVGHAVKTQGQVVAMRHINGKGGDHYKPFLHFQMRQALLTQGVLTHPSG